MSDYDDHHDDHYDDDHHDGGYGKKHHKKSHKKGGYGHLDYGYDYFRPRFYPRYSHSIIQLF